MDKSSLPKTKHFYSSSHISTGKTDKDGNFITTTKEYVNNNGKESNKEYTNTIKKEDLKHNKAKTFILE